MNLPSFSGLELIKLTKSFFGTPVLCGVSLKLSPGRILGLVGENGAGKSTLMNILGGNLAPDSGLMILDGVRYAPHSPRDAEAARIAFIHQELNLFSHLSIAENLFLMRFPRKWGLIDRGTLRQRSLELLRLVGLDLSPSTPVEQLSAGERQLVEIARAILLEPRVIILDEPTTSLTAPEISRLFALLKVLRERGISMIYISHALDDVRHLCDEIMVLRDGAVVGRGPASKFDETRLVSLMVGRQIDQQFPAKTATVQQEVLLEVRGVSLPGVVKDISLKLHRGEVLGLGGLMGSGRTELARLLSGLDRQACGEILLDGTSIGTLSPSRRVAQGLAYLTESRRDDGLCMEASIAENLRLVCAPRYAGRFTGRIDHRALATVQREVEEEVRLQGAHNLNRPVRTLSGGNQQKVVLAKWLLNRPRVLILDEPTRGIDVGARYDIYGLIDRLAAEGTGVLVISSEIEELIGLCDRLLVLSRGEIRDELPRSEFDRDRILRAALRGDTSEVSQYIAAPDGFENRRTEPARSDQLPAADSHRGQL